MSEKTAQTEEQVTVFHPDFFIIPEDGGKPYLRAFKCQGCGKMWIPKLPICPECWSEKFEGYDMKQAGKLYSYTIIRVPQPGIKRVPMAVGYVDFPEGIRVGAQIDLEPERLSEIKIGMDLEVVSGVIRQDAAGNKTISYVFKPLSV